MEVFEEWQIAAVVEGNIDVMLRVAGIFVATFLALRVVIEIYRTMVAGNMKFSIAQFVPILIILVALISYKEIMFLIGDAFFSIGNAIRGESENTFKLTNIWEAVKEQLGPVGEGGEKKDYFDLVQGWLENGANILNPIDWVQNFIGIQTAMSWQLLGYLFRLGMVFFKNVVYALILIGGPIPLMLSLVPGLQGLAAHWMKNFILVCCWNVTLAIIDSILGSLNIQLWMDIFTNGDEELTIALVTAMAAISYLFVPYVTSLLIGQTVAALAGSRLVVAPVATMLALGKMAVGTAAAGPAGTAASAGTSGAKKGGSTAFKNSNVGFEGSGSSGYRPRSRNSYESYQNYGVTSTARNQYTQSESNYSTYVLGSRNTESSTQMDKETPKSSKGSNSSRQAGNGNR